jgi:hypothetical protein
MSLYCDLLAEMLAAVEIHSRLGHRWFGTPSPTPSTAVADAMAGGDARSYVLFGLRSRLYADFYCQGLPVQTRSEDGPYPVPGEGRFVQRLSGANQGTGAWQNGWTVKAEHRDHLVVSRGGVDLRAPHSHVRKTGARAAVHLPKELLRLSPGFYMALGDHDLDATGQEQVVRWYWNLRAGGAEPLMRALTRAANAADLPFRLKMLHDPDHYRRCDAGVLYTRRRDQQQVADLVDDAYAAVAEHLKPRTPALTKHLRPGLGLAEDPGEDQVSFGTHRCHLLAEGIVRAWEQGQHNPGDRLATVLECLAEAGVDPDRPYLNPGSIDDYVLADSVPADSVSW